MRRLILNHLNDESGAATVQWVVLTAFLVGLALATVMALRSPFEQEATGLQRVLCTDQVYSDFAGAAQVATALSEVESGAGTPCEE